LAAANACGYIGGTIMTERLRITNVCQALVD
jgi:hypothetical protein